MIDRPRLLSWLRDRATTPNPIVHAIYVGLAERIDRGDFDTNNHPNEVHVRGFGRSREGGGAA